MRYLTSVLAAGLAACLLPAPQGAVAQSAPLLMEGKDTLFQRVLVRDARPRRPEPDGPDGARIAPLTPLYVYAREDDWLQVGLGETGGDLFWIEAAATVAWNQNIVATFEGSENLGRLLFFNDVDPIYDLLEMERPGLLAEELRAEAEAAEAGGAPSDTIVALGPRRVIDQRENLYVMPIIDFEEEVFDNGTFVKLLQVAVARAGAGPHAEDSAAAPIPEAGTDAYRLGVVFVVDTTISMDPYIRATRDALRAVYDEIVSAGAADAVSFGLIGYRDALAAAPDLGYATRTFVTLDEGLDPARFMAGIDQMTEATTSSRNFREDSYAGVEHALSALDWRQFQGRFIVLVTDAGPREVGDEFSQTGLSGTGLNQIVRERINGAIAVMHLKTNDGASDHSRAEAAYRELSRFPNQAPFYFPIDDGDPEAFRDSARGLGQLLAGDVLAFRGDPEAVLRADGRKSILEEDAAPDTTEAEARFSGLRSAGRTMQLAYLGRVDGARAPDVFEAHVADRDFDRTGLKPLSIRVLITKAQLSALYDALTIIVEKGEENIVDPDQFFAQVLGAAADMSRTPDKVARQSEPSLAEAVAIEDYIEDLPYRSRIMSITEDDWLDMSFSAQASIINDLYDKIARYQEYNEATDLWVDYLGTGAAAEDLLFPLPLDDLP